MEIFTVSHFVTADATEFTQMRLQFVFNAACVSGRSFGKRTMFPGHVLKRGLFFKYYFLMPVLNRQNTYKYLKYQSMHRILLVNSIYRL